VLCVAADLSEVLVVGFGRFPVTLRVKRVERCYLSLKFAV
jgi:hypothetical protein